jgi:SAM-dependent methyltransferase
MEAIVRSVRRLRHFGRQRYCPACDSHSRGFGPYGVQARPDARCLICNSSERERAQVLLLQRKVLPKLAGKAALRVLHIAPEGGVGRLLRKAAGSGYVSGDAEAGKAMQVLDLTALPFADASFDLFFASHVLEHIPDDRRAMAEIRRVLVPQGLAYIEVPVLCQSTFEDASITTPEQRRAAYGQEDHVRLCGLDYEARLKESGFVTEALWVEREFSAAETSSMRLVVELPSAIQSDMPARYERHHHVAWLCQS